MNPTQIKLRTITRSDLPIGYQAVQSAHAAIQFQHEYPEEAKEWYTKSNYLIFLSVKDENELKNFIRKLENERVKFSVFREPDINNQITAVTLEPGQVSDRLTKHLKLMK